MPETNQIINNMEAKLAMAKKRLSQATQQIDYALEDLGRLKSASTEAEVKNSTEEKNEI